MAGLFSPRSTARRNSRNASSALPSRCRDTAVARDRERPPFSSELSLDPFAALEPFGLPDPGLLTTDRRGGVPISTAFGFTELISLPSFLFSRSTSSSSRVRHRAADYDSFGTRIEHSLPKKSLFLVTFIQYSLAFSLPSAKNPTPPDLSRSSLQESTSCPSIEVTKWLPLTSTCTR